MANHELDVTLFVQYRCVGQYHSSILNRYILAYHCTGSSWYFSLFEPVRTCCKLLQVYKCTEGRDYSLRQILSAWGALGTNLIGKGIFAESYSSGSRQTYAVRRMGSRQQKRWGWRETNGELMVTAKFAESLSGELSAKKFCTENLIFAESLLRLLST